MPESRPLPFPFNGNGPVCARLWNPPTPGPRNCLFIAKGSRHGLAFPFNGNGPVQIPGSCGLPAEATGPHRPSSWPDWDATKVVGKWKKRGALNFAPRIASQGHLCCFHLVETETDPCGAPLWNPPPLATQATSSRSPQDILLHPRTPADVQTSARYCNGRARTKACSDDVNTRRAERHLRQMLRTAVLRERRTLQRKAITTGTVAFETSS